MPLINTKPIKGTDMKKSNYLVWLFTSMISVVFVAAESPLATDNLPKKLKEAILVEAEVTTVQPGKYEGYA